MSRQRLRPSQMITTFGPGAIVDLPDDSIMIAGIEHWFDSAGKDAHARKILDPRLERILDVNHFRTPPTGSPGEKDIPYVRFPHWRVCPKCNRLWNRFSLPKNRPDVPYVPRCEKCDSTTYPARLVAVCPAGHIDDFPWYRWVHRNQKCVWDQLHLSGEGRSASLRDLRVECKKCGAKESLAGALGEEGLKRIGCICRGLRPWLNKNKEECSNPVHALMRGASNIYFSIVRSALSIPPWSNNDILLNKVSQLSKDVQIPITIDNFQLIRPLFPDEDEEHLRRCIEHLTQLKNEKPQIRKEEYEAFSAGNPPSLHFETRPRKLSTETTKYLSELIAVPRLREVRALTAFTRIDPPEMDPLIELLDEEQGLSVTTAPLTANNEYEWLPAVENFGEGIFLKLNAERLKEWESLEAVSKRAGVLLQAYSGWRQKRGLQVTESQGPRLILLHTLAHSLIRQMSLDSGYSSASLRERIYSDDQMTGLLIYTSTPDSDGSLGGLVQQTISAERFENLLISTRESVEICSNDPLCREHNPRRTERLNSAACHACTMVSETSCEFGNRLLDRGMIVNLPNQEPTGYFNYDA